RGILLIIIVVLIIFFIILYIMPVQIKILYKLNNKNNTFAVETVTLFVLFHYKIDTAFLKEKLDQLRTKIEKVKELTEKKDEYITQELKKVTYQTRNFYSLYKDVIQYFLNKIKISQLHFKVKYDLEDAAITGVIFGILYTLQSNILIWVLKHKKIPNCKCSITPLFKQQNVIYINLSCIIQFKLGHII